MQKRPASRGFTFIELLLTLVIIAIVAMAVVPIFTDLIYEAKVSVARGCQTAYRAGAEASLIKMRLTYPNITSIHGIYIESGYEVMAAYELAPDLLQAEMIQGSPSMNPVMGGLDIIWNQNTVPPADPTLLCESFLEHAPGTDGNSNGRKDGWIFFRRNGLIYAYTDDCSRYNPAA